MSDVVREFPPAHAMRARLHALELQLNSSGLKRGGGGGTSGGMTEDWKASVDAQLVQLHGDVRNLLYGLIGGFLFLIAGGAAIYVKLSEQATAIQIEQAKSSSKLDNIDERLVDISSKLDAGGKSSVSVK